MKKFRKVDLTDKNVKLIDTEGNTLFSKTIGSIIKNNLGGNLGDVEAEAQVNKIEKSK